MSEPWQLRPATTDDHAEIVRIGQVEDIHYRGLTDFTLEMLEAQLLEESTFDAQRDLVVAERDGGLIGAVIITPRPVIILVDPAHESSQLRTELLRWSEARQREMGRDTYRIGTYASMTPAAESIQTAGYTLERIYSQMVRTFAVTGPPEPADLAKGYRIRGADPVADAATLHGLHERAFGERIDHTPQKLDDYVRAHLTFSQFDPAWTLVVETTDGDPAGSVVGWRPPDHPHGYIATLAVDPDHRRRGLGRALLLTAFAAIYDAGLPAAELHVASDNPRALDLYSGVGMTAAERIDDYIRPA
jgi:mycothiol synthase